MLSFPMQRRGWGFGVDEYLEANRARWNELAPIHAAGEFYKVAEFKQGKSKLHPIELDEMGDVQGKSLLHLQCHFGMDTLSWARLGATVTGIDFSEAAIAIARELAAEVGINARFVQSSVYELPEKLDGQFDIVFTSWGVLGWLPDLKPWGRVIAHFLRPGGTFYIAECHPVAWIFDDAKGVTDLRVRYPYFHSDEPLLIEEDGSYADKSAQITNKREYSWVHSISDILGALIDAGLHIEFFHEHDSLSWQLFPFMTEDERGMWRMERHAESIPLSFSIKATKPR